MEISMQLKPNLSKRVPFLYQEKLVMGKGRRVNTTISCRVKDLAMKKKSNFYEVLSLSSEEAGFDEIKKAYRSMALELHPDVCPPSNRDESTRKFVELRKAYETLSDPISRKMYDYELSLVDCVGHDLCGLTSERRGSVSREVWEMQLCGLKKRSLDRMEKKKNGNCM